MSFSLEFELFNYTEDANLLTPLGIKGSEFVDATQNKVLAKLVYDNDGTDLEMEVLVDYNLGLTTTYFPK